MSDEGVDLHVVEAWNAELGAYIVDQRERRGHVDQDTERQMAWAYVEQLVKRESAQRLQGAGHPIGPAEAEALIRAVMDLQFGWGPIQEHIDNPDFSEVVIDGHDRVHAHTRAGDIKQLPPVANSDEALVQLVVAQASQRGRPWDSARPILDLELEGGHRLNAVGWDLTPRPSITIRRHDLSIHRMEHLVELGTLSPSLSHFLTAAVHAQDNMFYSGGTNTAKTTLLRCTLNEAPFDRRIVTIEDTPELSLERWPDLHLSVVPLQTRRGNAAGKGEVTGERLLETVLRMRPDHVVYGEFRGGEVLAALQSMNTGIRGSISTVHAGDAQSTFGRIRTLMLMTPQRFGPEVTNSMIGESVDYVVHLRRLVDGQRVVSSVIEVDGVYGLDMRTRDIYVPDATGRAVPVQKPTQARLARLESVGFDPGWLEPHAGRWPR